MKDCTDCIRYENQIKQLQQDFQQAKEEIAYLKFELDELKSKRYKSKNKPPQDNTPLPHPKKKGGFFGHIGWLGKSRIR